ncbi:MAG: hypothetical protein K6C99_10455 [Lachnospiraceae bacterium]|nr:hypothetical protein [Lachnospiraceae bacterium]
MKKKKLQAFLVILILFILINIPIFIRGNKLYGDNWIDFSKEPSVCYYNGNVYYEISEFEFARIDGEWELMDKWISCDGTKANILNYYFSFLRLDRRVGEVRNDKGTPIALLISSDYENDKYRYYKLSEEESQ